MISIYAKDAPAPLIIYYFYILRFININFISFYFNTKNLKNELKYANNIKKKL